MINLVNVSRHVTRQRQTTVLLDRVNLRIDPCDRVGILAASGTGKTTLARLISGREQPDAGVITADETISWPFGFSSAFHPHLSCDENIRLVAGLHFHDPDDLALRVADFAELGDGFRQPVGLISPGERARLAIALSLTMHFDFYLADELSSVGTHAFQDRVEARLEDRLHHSGLILLTRHAHTIDRLATRFVVLARAGLIECQSAAEAADILALAIDEEAQNAAA